jgi:hypothetical protein
MYAQSAQISFPKEANKTKNLNLKIKFNKNKFNWCFYDFATVEGLCYYKKILH